MFYPLVLIYPLEKIFLVAAWPRCDIVQRNLETNSSFLRMFFVLTHLNLMDRFQQLAMRRSMIRIGNAILKS